MFPGSLLCSPTGDWGGDDAVPDIGRPGRESPVLFHAARLLARQDIQVVAVMAEHLPPVE